MICNLHDDVLMLHGMTSTCLFGCDVSVQCDEISGLQQTVCSANTAINSLKQKIEQDKVRMQYTDQKAGIFHSLYKCLLK